MPISWAQKKMTENSKPGWQQSIPTSAITTRLHPSTGFAGCSDSLRSFACLEEGEMSSPALKGLMGVW
jgi:hypothetical protein